MKKSLFSTYQITVSQCDKNKAITALMDESLPLQKSIIADNRELIITVQSRYEEAYRRVFEKNNIIAEFTEIKGRLNFFRELKGRIGLLLGLVILLFTVNLSSKIIWKIDIDGNVNCSEEEILSELKNVGLTLGTYIPNIDYDVLHNRILLNSEKLSWISVNITGNVANVLVKENTRGKNLPLPTYTNVVAENDGYIASVKVINGKKIVSAGDVVKKGELLISGIIDSQSQGIRYEHATGEVMAYVNKEINIKVPYKSTKKIYTGNKYTDKDYKIFDFPIKFLSKYRNQAVLYDKIEKTEKVRLFNVYELPIETVSTMYYEYEEVPVVLSKQEATDIAFSELRLRLDVELKNAELVSKTVSTSFDESFFYIRCELYCIEDIAKEQEFYITK